MMTKQAGKEQRAGGCPLPPAVVATERRTKTFKSKKLPEPRVEVAATLPKRMSITHGEVVGYQLAEIRNVAIKKKQRVVRRHISVGAMGNRTVIGRDRAAEILCHRQADVIGYGKCGQVF